jgi:signal transduction histidine kinase
VSLIKPAPPKDVPPQVILGSRSTVGRLVRIVVPVLVLALIGGAALDYRRTARDLERQFTDKQLFVAREAAYRITEIFREVRNYLVLLGNIQAVVHSDPAALFALALVVWELEEHGAILAFRVDAQGKVTLSSSSDTEQLRRLWRLLPSCTTPTNLCLRGPIQTKLARSGRAFIASMSIDDVAIAMQAHDPAESTTAAVGGSVALLLDGDTLQETISRITRLAPHTSAWVVDHRGRLILPGEHPDQPVPRMEQDKPCAQCHSSFQIYDQMMKGTTGTGRLQIAGEEPKLVAFTPLRPFRGAPSWSLAVATPVSVAASELGRMSLSTLLLVSGAILVVIFIGGVLLDREASRRIRAADAFSRVLEERVVERTAEMQVLYDSLSALQAQHTRLERVAVAGEMAAIVAHEIRTPLNALSINAQLVARMLRRGQEDARDKALEALGSLQKEIARINSLVEEHLSTVRHRPGSMRPMSVRDVVREAAGFMEPEATRKNVRLFLDVPEQLPPVHGDEAKLRQVVLNIVLNAIQAMASGGEVHISVSSDEETVQITIQDNGPGIANLVEETDVEQFFRPFTTSKADGTGLGLAICARLAKEMGGRIRVSTGSGRGACFAIALPIFHPSAEDAA